jgi:uncharacterized protein (TIGR02646 family)
MIPIQKNTQKIPAHLKSQTAIDKRTECIATRDARHVKSVYNHDTVREALGKLYHNKCAFCESPLEVSSAKQVDHYRPKAPVIGVENHDGYYWLAFEWSNLILTCGKCNRSKHNHFPVAGQHLKDHPEEASDYLASAVCLKDEQPLIIHPELVKNIREHFWFAQDGKCVIYTKAGKATVDHCDLDRDELAIERQDRYKKHVRYFLDQVKGLNEAVEEIEKIITDPEIRNKIIAKLMRQSFYAHFREMVRDTVSTQAYSAFASFMVEEFENVFVESLPKPELGELLLNAWRSFKATEAS